MHVTQTSRFSPSREIGQTLYIRGYLHRPWYRYNMIIILLWEPSATCVRRCGYLHRSTAATEIVEFPTSSPFENNYTRVRHVHIKLPHPICSPKYHQIIIASVNLPGESLISEPVIHIYDNDVIKSRKFNNITFIIYYNIITFGAFTIGGWNSGRVYVVVCRIQ